MDKTVFEAMSISELDALQKEIQKIIDKKEIEQFPYKVGECFYHIWGHHGGFQIMKINKVDALIEYDIINCDSSWNLDKTHKNTMSIGCFLHVFKNLVEIDPKIMDHFSVYSQASLNLKKDFMDTIKTLKHDKGRTAIENKAE